MIFGHRKQPDSPYTLEAAVLFRPNQKVNEKELSDWLSSFISIAIPIKFHIVHGIPRTKMGKVQRYKLQASTQLVPKL